MKRGEEEEEEEEVEKVGFSGATVQKRFDSEGLLSTERTIEFERDDEQGERIASKDEYQQIRDSGIPNNEKTRAFLFTGNCSIDLVFRG
ncbi:hypothetical protein K0M31_015163 [Melipona bicolor]|uniref:Uncharacterized protein n=1 Tax=Melipona bicolor TaxID=60889 RepID=A0AA40FG95_9HYME|nr:hypothetical protein K0M31_015163 [Melipona bicolor]